MSNDFVEETRMSAGFMPTGNRNVSLAYFFLRATLGVNILMHGVARIAAGQEKFVDYLLKGFHDTFLPQTFVVGFGYALPWAEAILGALILMGLFTRAALIAGAVLMIALTFGTSLQQDWQVAGLQLIYAGVYAALLALVDADIYSFDRLLNRVR